jgi:hypothetical protein
MLVTGIRKAFSFSHAWFRSKRDFVIIAYAIAMMTLSINFVLTILHVTSELTRLEDKEYIQPLRSLVSTVYEVSKQLNSAFFITSILSFILTWFASVLLLRHYSKKGRIRFWIIVCSPIGLFLKSISDSTSLHLYSTTCGGSNFV